MTPTPKSIEDQVAEVMHHVPADVPSGRRYVVALAGPPAAGKSTLASALVEALAPRAAILGLDAFHFDDSVLNGRGHRDRKGAPHTFDVVSYMHMLRTVRETRAELAMPVFDRDLELSRNCAAVITTEHDVVITEGNYLLADVEPWLDVQGLFDVTVGLRVPTEVVEQRILDRWLSYGFSAADARAKAETNDLPNARWVHDHALTPDLTLASP